MKLRILFASTFCLVASPIVGQIVNGSFKLGTAGWTFTGRIDVKTFEAEAGVVGTNCVAIGGGNIPNSTLSQMFNVVPNTWYELTLATAANGGGSTGKVATVQVELLDMLGNLLASRSFTDFSPARWPTGDDFTRRRIPFWSPSNTNRITIRITDTSSNGGDAVDPAIDDVTLDQAIIANGSFEAGKTNWSFTGGFAVFGPPAQPAAGLDGASYAKIGGGNIPDSTLSQLFPVLPWTRYVLTLGSAAWAATAGKEGRLRVELLDPRGGLLASQSFTNTSPGPLQGTNGFVRRTVPFISASSSNWARLRITDTSPNGGDSVDPAVDDVRILQATVLNILAGPITNSASGHIYYLLTQANWTESQASARALGGDLATIDDAEEHDWVFDTFGSYAGAYRALWIGLTDRDNEGVFTWISGSESSYRNWKPGEPNNPGGVEHYVHMTHPGSSLPGTWNNLGDVQSNPGIPLHGVVEITPIETLPPSIVVQPQSQTVTAGSTVTFNNAVAGTPPFTYQWQFNGSEIAGATNSALLLFNVQAVHEGDYCVVVRNAVGASTSSPPAKLIVLVPPTIDVAPQDRTVVAGAPVAFSVTATGSAPLVYQWSLDGQELRDATNASLSLANVQPADAGEYCVVVGNPAGFITNSPPAVLTVLVPPTITRAPQSQRAVPGTIISFDVAADGSPPLLYQWFFNGTALPHATNAILALTNVRAARAGYYSVSVGNAAGSATSTPPASLLISNTTDTVPPTLTVTWPLTNGTGTNATVIVTGSAHDDRRVAGVWYRINGSPWQLADGAMNWSAEFQAVPGTNRFRAYCIDWVGNRSPISTLSFFRVVREPLTLQVVGEGTVTPDHNGSLLKIGRGYTVTAMPSPANLFSNWIGRWEGQADFTVLSTKPQLCFVMRSNLLLQANFVPNPFLPLQNSYNGLFYETDAVRIASSGFFSASLTSKGMFSGKLLLAGQTNLLTGRFDLSGEASSTISRTSSTPLEVRLRLDLSEGGDRITGTIGDGTWVAELRADRAVYDAVKNPAPFAGRYTLSIPGNEHGIDSPGGEGWCSIVVKKNGRVLLFGALADAVLITGSVPVSKDGYWPLYLPLYAGKGSVMAWMKFSPSLELTNLLASWIKPAKLSRKLYPGGFTNEVSMVGSSYVEATNSRLLNLTNAVVVFSGANLPQPVTNWVTMTPANQVVNMSSNPMSLEIDVTNGCFKGTFSVPGTLRTNVFQGVVLQNLNRGVGYFRDTNQIGRVFFGVPE